MGDFEAIALAVVESSLKYHPGSIGVPTQAFAGRGQCVVGSLTQEGFLLKSNGEVRRYPKGGLQSLVECKGIRMLDCETDRSSRVERRS